MGRRLVLVLFLASSCADGAPEVSTRARPLAPPLSARLDALVRVAADGMAPGLSPDAGRVAFTRARFQGIWVAPVDGGAAAQLTDDPGAGYRFSWSPDGARIAWATREEDGSRRVRVAAVEGGEPVTLFVAAPGAPVPAPRFDGAGRLLYLDGDRLVEAGAGAISSPLPSPRMLVALDAAGLLVGAGEDGVWAVRPDGSRLRSLFREGGFFFDPIPGLEPGTVLVREIRERGTALWVADALTGVKLELGAFDRACALASARALIAETSADDGRMLTGASLFALRADGSAPARIETPAGMIPHRVDCARAASRIAFGDEASGGVFVAEARVEVAR